MRFIDDSGFDGVFADRVKDTVITGLGEWPNASTAVDQRSIMLPASVASDARAEVGDVLESLTFAMVVDRNLAVEGGISESDCQGGDIKAENGMVYCRMLVTVNNLTVAGVYEEADLANPTIPANALILHLDVLEEAQRQALMNNDHVYLAMAVDRRRFAYSSTADAAEWLDDVQRRVGQGSYTDAGISLVYIDIIGGTISFLNIFLGLIQTFDYIIMVPIVILSVLVYGLVLSSSNGAVKSRSSGHRRRRRPPATDGAGRAWGHVARGVVGRLRAGLGGRAGRALCGRIHGLRTLGRERQSRPRIGLDHRDGAGHHRPRAAVRSQPLPSLP